MQIAALVPWFQRVNDADTLHLRLPETETANDSNGDLSAKCFPVSPMI